MFNALNQPVPADLNAGAARAGRGRGDNAGQTAPPAQTPAARQPASPDTAAQPQTRDAQQGATPQQRGGGDTARQGGEGRRGGFDPNMTPEERQRRRQERMAGMTPEEREAFQQRMAQRGQRGGGAGGAGAPGQTSQPGGRAAGAGQRARPAAPRTAAASGAQTVDALFAPLPVTSQRGRVWMVSGTEQSPQLKALTVRTGITDGQWAELLEGELTEGQEVVTGVILANAAAQVPGTTGGNPLMGPQRGQPARGGSQPAGRGR